MEKETHKSSQNSQTSTQGRRPLVQVCLSGSWGGLEMNALDHALWLAGEGHSVLNLVSPESPLAKELQKKNLPVCTYRGAGSLWTLRKAFHKEPPPLVIYQNLRDLFLAPFVFPKSTPTVGYLQMFLSVHKKDLWHQFLYRHLKTLVVLTEAQKRNALEHLPVSAANIAVIPNGVDLARFSPEKKVAGFKSQLGFKEGDFLVGVVGRFDPQKGQMETLEALRQLKGSHPELKVIFVGEDTANSPGTGARLQKFINAQGLQDSAQILPFTEDIPQVMASLDLFLMPSYGETFGRVLIEAMASGTPVMSTRAGGVVDIVEDGVHGLLAEPASAESLAQVLTWALGHPEKLSEMTEAALQKAHQCYSYDEVQRQLQNLYRQISPF